MATVNFLIKYFNDRTKERKKQTNKPIANYRNTASNFNKTSNFKVAIIEMIPLDLVAHFVMRCNTRTVSWSLQESDLT
jgi:hypothetical protein